MGRLDTALKEEMARVGKKVVRERQAKTVEEVKRLKKRVTSLQAEVDAIKRELATMRAKQRIGRAARSVSQGAQEKIRMSPTLIKKLRRKLGISQSNLAALVGVSDAAVGFWEAGKTSPRPTMKARIAALRKLGRRDVQRLLAEKTGKPPSQSTATRRKGVRRKK